MSISPSHFDTVTGTPCVIEFLPGGNHCWVRYTENGRPKTRHVDQVITMAERAAETEKAKEKAVEKEVTFWVAEAKRQASLRAEVEDKLMRVEHACEVQHWTLQWLYDNVLDFSYDFTKGRVGGSRTPTDIAVDGERAQAPGWVLDCLAVANSKPRP